MKASSDTTKCHREILIQDGPLTPEGMGYSPSRYQIKVDRLSIDWTQGEDARLLFASGRRVLKDGALGVQRGLACYSMNWDSASAGWPPPTWALELLDSLTTNHR